MYRTTWQSRNRLASAPCLFVWDGMCSSAKVAYSPLLRGHHVCQQAVFFWLNVKGKGGGLPHPEIRRQKRGSNYPPSLSHLSAPPIQPLPKLWRLLASRFDSRGSNEKEAPSASALAAQKPTPREGRSRVVSLSRGERGGPLILPFSPLPFPMQRECVCM